MHLKPKLKRVGNKVAHPTLANQPILLIVHPRTKIAEPVQKMVRDSKGKIRIFDPQTKKLTDYK
ncbi:MAG: hypothetical protein IJR46_07895 [Neisseriaceae bacterium]|nr:hypothetical protein [Neisseriaceae bacterium]